MFLNDLYVSFLISRFKVNLRRKYFLTVLPFLDKLLSKCCCDRETELFYDLDLDNNLGNCLLEMFVEFIIDTEFTASGTRPIVNRPKRRPLI